MREYAGGGASGDLIGRDAELAALTEAVGGTRLLTIAGPGGVGKTCLASAFVEAVRLRFEDRAWWVELAPIDEEKGLVAALASSVGADSIGRDPLRGVATALGDEPALVVIDCCEHVASEAAHVVATLVRECRGVRVIATSRVPLGLAGERVVRLAPLEVPAPDDAAAIARSPAIALFARRAEAVRRGFVLDGATTPAVVEICRRLDGLPLALELAAGLARLMPVPDIARRLDDDRFRLLRSGQREVDDRHRSLDDVIAWSYQLLTEEEQDLLDHLSTFTGSFSLAGAHKVGGGPGDELDTLVRLTSLVDHSMVVPVGDDEARFTMLESIREFGRRNIGTDRRWHVAHRRLADFEGAFASAVASGIRGPDEAAWARRADDEIVNLVEAFRWCIEVRDVDRCVRLVVDLFDYVFHRIRHEIGALASEAAELPGVSEHPRAAELLAAAGYLEWQRGLGREADDHIARSLAVAGSWIGFDALGTISLFRGDVAGAAAAYAQAEVEAGRSAYLQAVTKSQLALVAMYGGEADAEQLAAQAEAAAVTSGNPTALAQAAWAAGLVRMEAEPELALPLLERAMALSDAVRNRLAHGAASVPAEELRTRLDRRSAIDDVRAGLAELQYLHDTGSTVTQGVVLRRVVWALVDLGELETAALVAGAESRASLNLPMRPRERRRHEAVLAALAEQLGDSALARLLATGATLGDGELLEAVERTVRDGDGREGPTLTNG